MKATTAYSILFLAALAASAPMPVPAKSGFATAAGAALGALSIGDSIAGTLLGGDDASSDPAAARRVRTLRSGLVTHKRHTYFRVSHPS